MEESLKVAQGISDFGFMVIVCAVFLCLAAALMIACLLYTYIFSARCLLQDTRLRQKVSW